MEQIGTCLGYVGVLISAVIYQQKSRRGLILWKTIADFVWTVPICLLVHILELLLQSLL